MPFLDPKRPLPALVLSLLIASTAATTAGSAGADPILSSATGHEPTVGGPCEGCEAVFQGLPLNLSPEARITPLGETGEPLQISGRVLDANGKPVRGIVVYAYQTDAEGIYPRAEGFHGQAAQRHGLLRGWAQSDGDGRYRFE